MLSALDLDGRDGESKSTGLPPTENCTVISERQTVLKRFLFMPGHLLLKLTNLKFFN